MMRVYYDSQTFMRQRSGGISRVFSDLIAAYDVETDLAIEPLLSMRRTPNVHASALLAHRGVSRTPHWLPRAVSYAPAWLSGPHVPLGVDLVHHTYYSRRFMGRAKVPRVSTVYDMIPELLEGTGVHTGTHHAKREFVEHSDLVICISESTKRDLLDLYGPIQAEICVVPLSVHPNFAPGRPRLPDLPNEYVLYVGGRKGYKDFELLPQALSLLTDRGMDVPLVIAGQPLTTEEGRLMRRCGVDTRLSVRNLSDDDLARAYAHALALVQTSRYEGFGLPPLEAMASGTVAIVANSSSMPEVCADVGQYFEPGDVESLAVTLERVINDDAQRSELAAAGVIRAAQFSTRRMAELTAQAYRRVVRRSQV